MRRTSGDITARLQALVDSGGFNIAGAGQNADAASTGPSSPAPGPGFACDHIGIGPGACAVH